MAVKIKSYKGFKIEEIIEDGHDIFRLYTNEEWAYGKGLRSYEWDVCTIEEAKRFIDSYKINQ
jgi:hypothetical protein